MKGIFLKMQDLFKTVVVLISITLVQPNEKTINGIFEGRLKRARNTAIASNIAEAIKGKNFLKPNNGNIKRSHVFVTPQEVNVLFNSKL